MGERASPRENHGFHECLYTCGHTRTIWLCLGSQKTKWHHCPTATSPMLTLSPPPFHHHSTNSHTNDPPCPFNHCKRHTVAANMPCHACSTCLTTNTNVGEGSNT